MALSSTFDVSRVTNLETRATADEAAMISNNYSGFQTIPNAKITGQLQVTGSTNGIVTQVDPAVNGSWMGIMQDATFYNMAIGRFATGSKAIEFRSYFDNLTIRTGRSSTATSADFNLITNDQVVNGISANANLMPRGWLNMCPNNGGLNTAGLQCLLVVATGQPALRSINTGVSNMMVKWASNGIHARDHDDTVFEPFFGSAFNVSSDIGFKEDIKDFSDSALDHVKNTRVRKYRLKNDKPEERDRIGLIRQEAPDQIHAGEESLDLYQMTSMLWKAVQELSAKVEELQK